MREKVPHIFVISPPGGLPYGMVKE